MKVAVYSIALNEEQFVQRWYESAKDADYLLIADTGSTDGTIELAKSLDINVVSVNVNPWRFDVARNASLAAIPLDIDYCIALDLDEVLQPGWKEQLKTAYESGWTRPRYKYTWSWNGDKPGLQYGGDKIHSRKNYIWKHPVHEVLMVYGKDEIQGWTDLEIHHHPDHSKSRAQYFHLLELAVTEDPTNDRNLFYLGREYFYHQMNKEAVETLQKYLQYATWNAERSAAYRIMAKCEPDNVEQHLLNSIKESERKEALLELALFYYDKDWNNCYLYAKKAIEMTEKPLDYLCEDWAWSGMDYDLLSVSAYNLNKFDEAIEAGQKAVEMNPENERLQRNLMFYKEKVDANTTTNG